jgi:integrase
MKLPALGKKSANGKTYAIVTLRDSATQKRRVFHLGDHGSPQAAAAYDRLIAEWIDNGRRHPDNQAKKSPTDRGPTVAELLVRFVEAELPRFGYSERNKYETLIRLLRPLYGLDAIQDFGPNKARAARQVMIDRNWGRAYINAQLGRLKSIWKWGASVELVPPEYWQALTSLANLTEGQTTATERRDVQPVPWPKVEQTLPFLSDAFAACARLQYLTGARPGEIVNLKTSDIDLETVEGIWIVNIKKHKTAHKGKTRTLYLGPAAQQILRPLLSTEQDRPVFFDLLKNRRRDQGKTKRAPSALRRTSYSRAIARACRQAFPPPQQLARIRVQGNGRNTTATRWETDREYETRLGADQWSALQAWEDLNHWHPNQLRHTAATEIAAVDGLLAAQHTLGHASAAMTDAVYAERNAAIAIGVARRRG